MKRTVDLGNKRYQELLLWSEWGPKRQQKLDDNNLNMKKISAAHMAEGFHYICKPQWTAGIRSRPTRTSWSSM